VYIYRNLEATNLVTNQVQHQFTDLITIQKHTIKQEFLKNCHVQMVKVGQMHQVVLVSGLINDLFKFHGFRKTILNNKRFFTKISF